MQRKLTFHDMSGTGTKKKKKFRLQMSYTNESIKWRSSYQNESTQHIKSSELFYRGHKKVSMLTNCCDFKELLQRFEENRFIKEIKEPETSIKKKFVPLLEWC
jgi:hypothetical protein